jgi:hypothetical protein
MAPDQLPDPLAVVLEMAALLERLRIPCLAAGSLASSFHGEPRSTNDVDFVVDLAPGRIPDLMIALGDRYYASADAMAEAVRAGGAFNLIHCATAVKVDLFVAGDDAFDAERAYDPAETRVVSAFPAREAPGGPAAETRHLAAHRGVSVNRSVSVSAPSSGCSGTRST